MQTNHFSELNCSIHFFLQTTFTRSLSQKIRVVRLARKRKSENYDLEKEKTPTKFRTKVKAVSAAF